METKKFTKFEIARIRRTAANVAAFIKKKNVLINKIEELQKELDKVNSDIEITDAPTVAMTDGYGTEDLFEFKTIPTDKIDKNGNIVNKKIMEFKFPDTIVPPVEKEQEQVVEDDNTAFNYNN